MRRVQGDERGAALVMVLVFMVITLILITAVLAVTGNEIQIAALHRDGVRALDLAHAGLQEAIARIIGGHTFADIDPGMDPCRDGNAPMGFTSSLDSTNLKVGICGLATGTQFYEVRADATVGQAVRKLSRIVRITTTTVPPEILLAGLLTSGGSASTNGETYSSKSIYFEAALPAGLVYSGWRVGKKVGGSPQWCYGKDAAGSNSHCTGDDSTGNNWYPGTRLAALQADSTGSDIKAMEDATDPLLCVVPPPYDTSTFTGVRADDKDQVSGNFPTYGFDVDNNGAIPPVSQAKTNKHPCGLAYKYVPQNVDTDTGESCSTPGTPATCVTRYFKTVIYEAWFETYYKFQVNPQRLVKRTGAPCTNVCLTAVGHTTEEPNLTGNLQFAAVPPFPSDAYLQSICNNANPYVSNTTTICGRPGATPRNWNQTITGGQYDIGDPTGMTDTCPRTGGTPKIAYFQPDPGDEATFASGMNGAGVLLIDGNLTTVGGFTYTGTIIVNGDVNFGGGNVVINGGLVVKGAVTKGSGNITINASDCIGTLIFTTDIVIELGALWER